MDESLITQVSVGDKEVALELRFVDNIVLIVKLDGKEIFSGDWQQNLRDVFQEALNRWDEEKDE